jgi:glycerophosphoryl diester phosphodiesterase
MRWPPPRLKWHMLRRRKSDPGHLRANLEAALLAGAACEVDLHFTADGHAFCLHDDTVDRETTGTGPAALLRRSDVERLRQRDGDGVALESAPLFLDEVADMVRRHGRSDGGLVQLDVKASLDALGACGLERMSDAIGRAASRFVAGASDWRTPTRMAEAIGGVRRGFDPLDFYPRSMPHGAEAFRALGRRMMETAPDADIYYLEAKLVRAGLRTGINLVEIARRDGAEVDVWTIDADRPALREELAEMIHAGCTQVTSNDPDILQPLVEEIARCS